MAIKRLWDEYKANFMVVWERSPALAIGCLVFAVLPIAVPLGVMGLLVSIVLGIAIGLARVFIPFFIIRAYALYILECLDRQRR